MWELISIKEQKMYFLIEHLYYAENPLTLKNLAIKIGISKRSISAYIEELKERVKKANGTLISLSEGYELILPDNISIDFFQKELISSSTGLKLLECLFFKGEMRGFELEKELYISTSSLSRLITKLKSTLKDYGLFLDTHPYRIKGDEFLIRRFFTSYFIEAYGHQSWPFECVDFDELNAIMSSLVRFPGIKAETVNFHKFKVFSAVSLIRENKSYDIYQSKLSEEVIDKEEYSYLYDKISDWLDSFSFTFKKREQYTRLYTYYMFYYFRSYTDRNSSCIDSAKKNIITTGLSEISKSFELPSVDFTHIVDKIMEILYQYSKMTYSKALNNYLLFEPRDYNLLKIYSRQYPLFYSTLTDFIHNIVEAHNLDNTKANTDELLYTILSRWDQLSLHLYNKYSTCRLLVYSHLSLRHADSMASLLKAKLERACHVESFSAPLLTEEVLADYDFDIFVSVDSVSLAIDQPIITLHRKLSGYHLLPLLRAIDKCVTANSQKLQQALEKQLI